jgi:hypothetical protein
VGEFFRQRRNGETSRRFVETVGREILPSPGITETTRGGKEKTRGKNETSCRFDETARGEIDKTRGVILPSRGEIDWSLGEFTEVSEIPCNRLVAHPMGSLPSK